MEQVKNDSSLRKFFLTALLAVLLTACFTILIRRKGKYGDILSSDIAGLLDKMFILHDKHIILEIPDVHSI